MRTPASIARHPIHPMLVPIPIGLWIWMRTQAPGSPGKLVWLSLIAVGLLAISGWLGGKMVFEHGIAVDVPSEPGKTR